MIPYNALSDSPTDNVALPDGNIVSYEAFVCNLVKELGSPQQNMIHMLMGICGEAGELMDAIKKHTIYGTPLDVENIKEELGDLEWYMAGLRQMLDITRREVLDMNVRKLGLRYKTGSYTDIDAAERSDKYEVPPNGTIIRTYDDGQLVDPSGRPLQSTRLHIVDMTQSHSDGADSIGGNEAPEAKPVTEAAIAGVQDGDPMPDWLKLAIRADLVSKESHVVAWHVHKGIATTLTSEGTQKRYYAPDPNQSEQ